MAIEPLGSVMSVQMQSTVTQRTAEPVERRAEYTSVNVQPTEKIDATTSVVENAQSKGQNSSDRSNDQPETNEQIRKAVEQMNKNMAAHSEAIFGIHEETNRVTIKIVDKDTKEVIREIPPEKTLDMIAKVWEMAGILVDEKR